MDHSGHILVVMTHDTDFGDAFEREGDSREYFERFAGAVMPSASTRCCIR